MTDLLDSSIVTVTSTVTYLRRNRPDPQVLMTNYDYMLNGEKPSIYVDVNLEEKEYEQITNKQIDCSTLVISNDVGKFLQKIPTDEEKEKLARKIITLNLKMDDGSYVVISKIKPRMHTLIHPQYTLDKYYLFCDYGGSLCTILGILS